LNEVNFDPLSAAKQNILPNSHIKTAYARTAHKLLYIIIIIIITIIIIRYGCLLSQAFSSWHFS